MYPCGSATGNGTSAQTPSAGVCAKWGAVPVMLSFRWTGRDLARAMEDAVVRGVVYDREAAAEVGAALGAAGERAGGVVRVVAAPAGVDGAVPYRALLAYPAGDQQEAPRRADGHSVILFTSGTTGRPKGVVRTHGADHAAVLAMIVEHRWSRFERTLWVMPLHHTMGLHTLLCFVLLNGTLVCLPRLDPAEALRRIATEGVTALYLQCLRGR